eukprot:TRINITY_DN32_c3_g1_i2.p1 TRINITY_DN32_c3_g1~~TRINITY_DN32_c3_g1_i2.p1  ORF type:complete len:786 (-),score=283.11 TRINITY_DN32_c3_g1_i2:28-2340(-)
MRPDIGKRVQNDPRFARVLKDDRYSGIPKQKKEQFNVDTRFKGVFKLKGAERDQYTGASLGSTKEKFQEFYNTDKNNKIKKKNLKVNEKLNGSEENGNEKDGQAFDTWKELDKIMSNRKKEEKRLRYELANERKKQEKQTQKTTKTDVKSKKKVEVEQVKEEEEEEEEDEEEEEEEEGQEMKEEDIEDDWNDEDNDVLPLEEEVEEKITTISVGEETKRLAILNCDWEKIKATDLLAITQSFVPTGSSIISVTVYPSEYGLKCLKYEKERGPYVPDPNVSIDEELEKLEQEKLNKNDSDEEKEEEEEEPTLTYKYFQEKSRDQELDDMNKVLLHEKNRLKYYYAIVVCDTVETANIIYANCDQLELGITGNILDCRYVPDDFVISQPPRDTSTQLPQKYDQPDFETKSLKSTSVEISWDDNPYERKKLSRKNKSELLYDEDIKTYLASSSSSEAESEPETEDAKKHRKKQKKASARLKYQALLQSADEDSVFDSKKSRHRESNGLEITFSAGAFPGDKPAPGFEDLPEEEGDKELVVKPSSAKAVKDIVEKIYDKDAEENETDTIWEKYQRQRREKRQQRKLSRKEEDQQKTLSYQQTRRDQQGDAPIRVNVLKDELELLNLDLSKPSSYYQSRSSQKSDDKDQSARGKHKNKNKSEKDEESDNFDEDEYKSYANQKPAVGEDDKAYLHRVNVDIEDPRFQAMFKDPHKFELDPTTQRFRKSATLQKISSLRQKRKAEQGEPTNQTIASTQSLIETIKMNASILAKKQKL